MKFVVGLFTPVFRVDWNVWFSPNSTYDNLLIHYDFEFYSLDMELWNLSW